MQRSVQLCRRTALRQALGRNFASRSDLPESKFSLPAAYEEVVAKHAVDPFANVPARYRNVTKTLFEDVRDIDAIFTDSLGVKASALFHTHNAAGKPEVAEPVAAENAAPLDNLQFEALELLKKGLKEPADQDKFTSLWTAIATHPETIKLNADSLSSAKSLLQNKQAYLDDLQFRLEHAQPVERRTIESELKAVEAASDAEFAAKAQEKIAELEDRLMALAKASEYMQVALQMTLPLDPALQFFEDRFVRETVDVLNNLAADCLRQARSVPVTFLFGSSHELFEVEPRGPLPAEAPAKFLNDAYLLSANLFAKTLQASSAMAGHKTELQHAAYVYGHNLGLAIKLAEDLTGLANSKEASLTGVPAFQSLKEGQATPVVLYALKERADLKPIVERQFSESEDVAKAVVMVKSTQAVAEGLQLARLATENAVAAALQFPQPAPLVALADKVFKQLSQ